MDNVYVSQTLKTLCDVIQPGFEGLSIFIVNGKENYGYGTEVACHIHSLRGFLSRHPELSEAVVVKDNDYFGMRVLRVTVPGRG